jgi:PAS domain S-box-containing protein
MTKQPLGSCVLTCLSEIASPIRPLREDTLGSTVYDRFAAEPDLLAIAVVDARDRPLGLVERNAFSLRMASEYGRALYARRPVALLMDPNPLVVEGQTQIMAFTGETLSTHASEIMKGFIVVEQGRYLGVANSIALLQAASSAHQSQALQMQRLADSSRLLFEGNPVAMLVSDRDTYRIRAANSAALQQYGYSFKQFMDLTLLDLVSPDLRAALDHALRERDSYDGAVEWPHVHADGSVLFVEPFRRPIDYEGRPAMLSAMVDVTSRRRSEDQMRHTRAFLDTVVENIPEMLIARDAADERIILVNRAAESWLGRPRAEIIGKTDHDLFPADQADAFLVRRRASLAAGHAEAVEESIRSAEGEERIVATRFAAVAGGEGRAPFSLAICQDVTQQKRDAAALRHALEAAEISNRAKSQFLANMSHEIRTPMNGVVGVADALSATPLTPPQREMVSIVQSSAKALNRLLSDVLDLARVEAGRLDINREPFRLDALVREAAALFEPSARAKALDFTLAVSDGAVGAVEGDPVRIQQILFNLLSNAVKFTAQGSVRLDVARRSDASGVSEVWFEVRDTGVGFDSSKAQAVFDRFQQADGSITRRYGGSGLGLTISRELAELMGGSLTAESEQGAGALFRLRLPLPICVDPAVALADGGQRDQSRDNQSGESLRVLVADDHPTNLKVIELILGAAGCELVQVENGALAVEAFQTQAFDVVLMDLQMPVMDGLSAIAAIRAWELAQGRRAPCPILALSANALPEHVEATRAAGADAHLAKPLTASMLFDALDRLLLESAPIDPPQAERRAATA